MQGGREVRRGGRPLGTEIVEVKGLQSGRNHFSGVRGHSALGPAWNQKVQGKHMINH